MPRKKATEHFIIDEYDKILNLTAELSSSMSEYVQSNNKSNFVMLFKDLTHSDLVGYGKLTKKSNELRKYDDNILYYMSSKEMQKLAIKTGAKPDTAHQSCIGLKKALYELVSIPEPRNGSYLINDYYDTFLVNDTITYFQPQYTKIVFNKLEKKIQKRNINKWKFKDTELSEDCFTEISIHCCSQGIGMARDKDFDNLRSNMFKGDSFSMLFDIDNKKMFIMLQKNPVFFSIIGEINNTYLQYQIRAKNRLLNEIKDISVEEKKINEEVERRQQGAWRKALAKEMMGYTTNSNEVFCPFTYITANFSELGPLFIASHIKGYKDPNTKPEEKYDINNGLLLNANADALFDKHLITINENKELEFSFLLYDKPRLIQELRLNNDIFKSILNDKRMEYLKYHRSVFKELEKKRKSSENIEDIE